MESRDDDGSGGNGGGGKGKLTKVGPDTFVGIRCF